MDLHIIATRDIKANVFGMPMFVPHIGQAIRSFGDECQREDRNNPLWMHPEDYELMHLGVYNDITGQLNNQLSPTHDLKEDWLPQQIAVGSSYKR